MWYLISLASSPTDAYPNQLQLRLWGKPISGTPCLYNKNINNSRKVKILILLILKPSALDSQSHSNDLGLYVQIYKLFVLQLQLTKTTSSNKGSRDDLIPFETHKLESPKRNNIWISHEWKNQSVKNHSLFSCDEFGSRVAQ